MLGCLWQPSGAMAHTRRLPLFMRPIASLCTATAVGETQREEKTQAKARETQKNDKGHNFTTS